MPAAPSGSSPRVRGKHQRESCRLVRLGLIPACAGKTVVLFSLFSLVRAHPRVCGENTPAQVLSLQARGSSPRVRGKLHSQCVFIERSGLIPACAGKTATRSPPPPSPTAHPRVCGENRDRKRLYQGRAGSSPRVRGKHHLGRALGTEDRLIPACAGKTRSPGCISSRDTAHPRVCGENPVNATGKRWRSGSSPRVRGKLQPKQARQLPTRLIPACAGKTYATHESANDTGAHPRVCGENWGEVSGDVGFSGSSPRVRGKRECAGARPVGARLIPACAGKTTAPVNTSIRSKAHPRVCGENVPGSRA